MKSSTMREELEEYKDQMGVELYERLCRALNGNFVLEKLQAESVLAVHDSTLPYLKSSLLEIPSTMLSHWDWYQDQLHAWHTLSVIHRLLLALLERQVQGLTCVHHSKPSHRRQRAP